MKGFASLHKLLKNPQKGLLSSYQAKMILMSNPLLQFYMGLRLVVDKLYQVIQYKPAQCFKKLGEEVMNARRTQCSTSLEMERMETRYREKKIIQRLAF